ncbi:flagellar hook-length control protein FliK [Marinomonas sp. A79]|uniref:Flagellar hook-length control protein FliK n=1 Tax=Marinomonas vulgaris TaxID=2823372 RepID=A0ABS5HCC0_9GAMM|nr:flagellar hook-length control protein FliK [Marinomonas vulgaris]MBR7888689.1 flagellar hook-length control protein FliK [Marinomonas vulgaris]
MRTDSNTVLPLPSGVSSNKSSLMKVPSEKGANFYADFQQAKNATNTSSSANSVTTAGSPTHTATPQQTTADQNDKSTTTTITNSAPKLSGESTTNGSANSQKSTSQDVSQQALEPAKLVEQGGKLLQAEGEKTPGVTSSLSTAAGTSLTPALEKSNARDSASIAANLVDPELMTSESKAAVSSPTLPVQAQDSLTDSKLVSAVAVSDATATVESTANGFSEVNSDPTLTNGVQVSTGAAVGIPVPSQTSTKNSSTPVIGLSADGLPTKSLSVTDATESSLLSNGEVQSAQVVLTSAVPAQVTPVNTSSAGLKNADGASEKGAIDLGVKNRSNVTSPATLAALTGLANGDYSTKKAVLTDTTETSDKIDLAPLDNPDELSWVLSQMSASPTKSAPNTVSDAVAANSAAALSSGRSSALPTPDGTKAAGLLGSGLALNEEEVAAEAGDMVLEDGVLVNEPIELRKKEQEAILGRMSAQSDTLVGDKGRSDDGATGGLSSSIQTANSARPAAAAGILSAATNSPQTNAMTMSVPPGHPGWAGEMTQKVAWVARDGGHTAHIRLDPPELGSLTVKVSVDSDSNTQVSFVAATPQARDLLESQMGRLRDMLAQQGMDLSRADVDVSQQDTSGAQYKENDRNNNGARNGSLANDDGLEDDLIAANTSYVTASGVDYYA